MALFIVSSAIVLLCLNFYALIVWLLDIIPFLKNHPKGRPHGITNIAGIQDYFLARKIMREEGLRCPRSIQFFGITQILTVGCLLVIFVLFSFFHH
jgi:hypothetical protein